jgi:hypothetical protein
MTLWIPFSPGFLKLSQSPSTLEKAIEPSSFILQSGCKMLHHALNDFSKAGTLAITGRQVVGRARPIHSEMHKGRDSGDSFFRSVKASFFSNADHKFRSSAQRSPNGGSFICTMESVFENQAGGDELIDGRAEDDLLPLPRVCVSLALGVDSIEIRRERRVVVPSSLRTFFSAPCIKESPFLFLGID